MDKSRKKQNQKKALWENVISTEPAPLNFIRGEGSPQAGKPFSTTLPLSPAPRSPAVLYVQTNITIPSSNLGSNSPYLISSHAGGGRWAAMKNDHYWTHTPTHSLPHPHPPFGEREREPCSVCTTTTTTTTTFRERESEIPSSKPKTSLSPP